MAHIDHILILRVCLPSEGKEFHPEDCSAMLTLFENTMLHSLREQNVDFRVLAYVSHQVCDVECTQGYDGGAFIAYATHTSPPLSLQMSCVHAWNPTWHPLYTMWHP